MIQRYYMKTPDHTMIYFVLNMYDRYKKVPVLTLPTILSMRSTNLMSLLSKYALCQLF